MLIVLTLVCAAVLFVIDLNVPSGIGEWGLYLLPLSLTIRARQRWYPPAFAGLCGIFLLVGYAVTPTLVDWRYVLTDRLVGMVSLMVVASLLVQRKGTGLAYQQNQERLGLMARVTATVVGSEPLQEEGRKLAEQARLAFRVDACVIRVLEGDRLVLLAAAGVGEEKLEPSLPASWGLWREIISTRKPEFVRQAGGDPRTATHELRPPAESLYVSHASAPLLVQDQAVGILAIYSSIPLRAFPEMDLEHLQIMANHIAVAIVNDRLYKEVESQKNQLAEQVAERGRMEQALRESEERFRTISEQALMGIYIVQDERFSYVNPKFAEVFGYSAAELLALPSVFDIFEEVDRAQARAHAHHSPAGDFVGVRFQSYGRRKDGRTILVEAQESKTELGGGPAFIGTLQDITESAQRQLVLKRTTEQLQTLSRRLLELQEAERRQIARELHDEIGQALTALKINLQAVQRVSHASSSGPRLSDSIALVDRTLRQVRDISLDLRPSMLDDLGLYAALRWYADQQGRRSGLGMQVTAPDLAGRLDPAVETACFRVAQEALTNIVRHARASAVRVTIEADEAGLHLAVCDDGIGFDAAGLHPQAGRGWSLGLLGMKERASLIGGRIEVKSAPQEGTEVHAWFPLAGAASPARSPRPFAPAS